MPNVESLLVRTILCKVVGCSTHKTAMFFMLVVIHGLCHSQTQALNDIQLRHPRVQRLRSGGSSSSSASIATYPVGVGYLLYLSRQASEDPCPLCMREGWCASIFLASMYNVSKLAPACSLSGSSAIVNSKASQTGC